MRKNKLWLFDYQMSFSFTISWRNFFSLAWMKYFTGGIVISYLTRLLSIFSSISLVSSHNCVAKSEICSLILTKVIIHLIISSIVKSFILSNYVSFDYFSLSNSTISMSLKINLDSHVMHKPFISHTISNPLL